MHPCEPFEVVHPTHILMHRAHRFKSAGVDITTRVANKREAC